MLQTERDGGASGESKGPGGQSVEEIREFHSLVSSTVMSREKVLAQVT